MLPFTQTRRETLANHPNRNKPAYVTDDLINGIMFAPTALDMLNKFLNSSLATVCRVMLDI
jgi:hypothetical protein